MAMNFGTRGCIALMVAHCAGMLDLVALPVWIGTLIQHYGLDPQQSGSLVTLFLLGAVIASVTLAPRFYRLPTKAVASLGFLLVGVCFALVSRTQSFLLMGILHGIAGLCVGAALSVTHGTIARSGHPHRLFSIVGFALGIFSVIFLGATPGLIEAKGGAALFVVFAIIMMLAAAVSAFTFPVVGQSPKSAGRTEHSSAPNAERLPEAVWFGILGISLMALVQAMTFSFLERVGHQREFGIEAITGVLVALGLVNLFPAALAGVLEKRIPAQVVMVAGPVVQAMLAFTIVSSTAFYGYAAAASFFAAVMIFTHTFVFGALARLDRSGRAMAATPAMLMTGAAVGPLLGGTLAKSFGYESLGLAALLFGTLATLSFLFTRLSDSKAPVKEGVA
ncbi:Permeases of the major facilitator superfamily [Marinobacterium lacunae]|uniref:Permeases of the major facilitator superfamily n=1 Tax=Marinobacterium lacunae TaxID=1232683 RepID=A0A081FX16_9GAMM|nr:MFS transporter [Marinobacterium lacunae]KEA63071.1 Permeases of the major facilitator superfamily [Marinobacterium lacunae]